MAIMVLWCLCAYPHTLLTLTPLFYPLNHIQPLSCNTLFMAKGETWLYWQAMVSEPHFKEKLFRCLARHNVHNALQMIFCGKSYRVCRQPSSLGVDPVMEQISFEPKTNSELTREQVLNSLYLNLLWVDTMLNSIFPAGELGSYKDKDKCPPFNSIIRGKRLPTC